MHVLVRQAKTLDEAEAAIALDVPPGDIVVLSFTDSDLALVAGQAAKQLQFSVRTAPLWKLRHPASVDLAIDSLFGQAKAILVRLLGGADYWPYGLMRLSALCRDKGIALAVVPGDARDDTRLVEASTVSEACLRAVAACWRAGGGANVRRSLDVLAAAAGLIAPPSTAVEEWPRHGFYLPGHGMVCRLLALPLAPRTPVLLFMYRAHMLADDTGPIDALVAALAARGLDPICVFVSSLKEPETACWVESLLRAHRPRVIVSATAFAAGGQDGSPSPLDAAGVPVLQVALANASSESWQANPRGLGPADLAMHVVLPELDGRLFAGIISCKEDAGGVAKHRALPDRVALIAERVARIAALSTKRPDEKRLAVILSTYGGADGREGHAVGLDGPASLRRILRDLRRAGYVVGTNTEIDDAIEAVLRNHVACALGHVLIALQPERGRDTDPATRQAVYHDLEAAPDRGYLDFYRHIVEDFRADAMVHVGAHGTLEWLPGKGVALSANCLPEQAIGALPVVYPFIVNNPGEAAAAKRRLGAVMVGHLTPPLVRTRLSGAALEVERLLDELVSADGLDARRAGLLRRDLLDSARASGLALECGVVADLDDMAAIARIDAHLCDIKDMMIRDGLHVFGERQPDAQHSALVESLCASHPHVERATIIDRVEQSPAAEIAALLAALDGRFVKPGPAGAPTRGRLDALPTGRNIGSLDPRTLPTPVAVRLGQKAAETLVARYAQDHGDWPKQIILDLWGSASMRTGGEDFAQALALMGVEPTWDSDSSRITGFAIVPGARLQRPRVDVILRVSGLFRDAFASQITLFDQAVKAVAMLNEPAELNPLAGCEAPGTRIFGPAPGRYGVDVTQRLSANSWQDRAALGRTWLDSTSFTYGMAETVADERLLASLLRTVDAHVLVRDDNERDLLDSPTYAAHQGGAAAAHGGALPLYITDTATPERPLTRNLTEELSRVVRGRAANPRWLAGMMRHGHAGAAEIANTVDALAAYRATAPHATPESLVETLYAAVWDNAEVRAFLERANPAAARAIRRQFEDLIRRGLWHPRRNSVAMATPGMPEPVA
jgi:cobaltochelatase CobN